MARKSKGNYFTSQSDQSCVSSTIHCCFCWSAVIPFKRYSYLREFTWCLRKRSPGYLLKRPPQFSDLVLFASLWLLWAQFEGSVPWWNWETDRENSSAGCCCQAYFLLCKPSLRYCSGSPLIKQMITYSLKRDCLSSICSYVTSWGKNQNFFKEVPE